MTFVPLSSGVAFALSRELKDPTLSECTTEKSLVDTLVNRIAKESWSYGPTNREILDFRPGKYWKTVFEPRVQFSMFGSNFELIIRDLREDVVKLLSNAKASSACVKDGKLNVNACVEYMRKQVNRQRFAYEVSKALLNPHRRIEDRHVSRTVTEVITHINEAYWIQRLVDTSEFKKMDQDALASKLLELPATSPLGKMVRDWENVLIKHRDAPHELYFNGDLAKMPNLPEVDPFNSNVQPLLIFKNSFNKYMRDKGSSAKNVEETKKFLALYVEAFNKKFFVVHFDPKKIEEKLPKQLADWVVGRVKGNPDVVSGKINYNEDPIYRNALLNYEKMLAKCNGQKNVLEEHLKVILTPDVKDFQQIMQRLYNRLELEQVIKAHPFPTMFAKEVEKDRDVVTGAKRYTSMNLSAVIEFDHLLQKHGVGLVKYLPDDVKARFSQMSLSDLNSEIKKNFDLRTREAFVKEMHVYVSDDVRRNLDLLAAPGSDDYTKSLAKYFALYEKVVDAFPNKAGKAIEAIQQSLTERAYMVDDHKERITWCSEVSNILSQAINKLCEKVAVAEEDQRARS